MRFVRTDRNRNEITREEQEVLLGKCVAVIGLSVGNSAALTAAMEGVGGGFRLAILDHAGMVQMVDGTRISPALTQAMSEIGRTLSSWPQQASPLELAIMRGAVLSRS
ncbi:hypothetical protein [Lentzea californiensis]|uniref:hypothetical protein n=1 Tax=Lentzea californiensis TaxID=438851 RepID=UPI0021642467|nr:hypothetical protein [Lentzea californiensis]MCR3746589.1 hypothetical protein [Lentzea californiensis]